MSRMQSRKRPSAALRATIGRHTLDDVLKDQESVAAQLQATLDVATLAAYIVSHLKLCH